MHFKSMSVLLAAAVVTTLGGAGYMPVAQASGDTLSVAQSENPTAWFVQLRSKPLAEGGSASTLASERSKFQTALRAAGINAKQRFDYKALWNGYSLEMSARDARRVARMSGVAAVFPVVNVEAPPRADDGGSTIDVVNAIRQTGVNLARQQGWTGTGIKVGIIDTGIDYDHPDLGGCFGPGCKVAYGYDFVGDDYNSGGTGTQPIPVPDPDPDDCNGHGTHVAGITGARAANAGGVTGVAPDVTLGAYRVFGCVGSSSADVINAGLERAYLDGMQVVNLSLGAALQWPQYPTVYMSGALVKAGVVVVASAGNNGATGSFSLGAPGVGAGAIGVASFDNENVTLNSFTVNGTSIGYSPMTFSPPVPTSGTEEIVYVGRGCVDADLNAPGNQTDPYLADPAGKAALIDRGACSFGEKYNRAVAAGATSVVVANNVAGVVFGTLGAAPPAGVTAPAVGISLADGNFIKAQTAPVSMVWTANQGSFPNPTAGLISSFSSYGLAPTLDLKPDVGAPGGSIYSTYPLEAGGYTTLSGTSMSAPHVAGSVALMLQANPALKPLEIRDRLQNHADPKNWSGNPGLGFLDYVGRQGAGMIDVDDTINATTSVTPAKLGLGEGAAGRQSRSLVVRNWGTAPVTYNVSSVNSLSFGRLISPSGTTASPAAFSQPTFVGGAVVTTSTPTVTVAPGGTAVVKVAITPEASTGRVYGGYIVLTPTNGGAPLRVPFGGFTGDYQSVQPLDGFNNNPPLPWLTKLANNSFTNQPAGATYTMANGDIPWFLVHFNHHVQRLEFQIVDAATNQPLDPTYSNFDWYDHVGRNGTRTLFFSFPWDGTRFNGSSFVDVPNGAYRVHVRALKAMGSASNPAHWQVWTSPVVTIARP
jgi:subtilisin family serine protease